MPTQTTYNLNLIKGEDTVDFKILNANINTIINNFVAIPEGATAAPTRISSWALALTKPSYSASEIGADNAGSASAVQTNLDTHTGNTTIHITADERTKWNSVDSNFSTHSSNATIHITSDERTKWNLVNSNFSTHSADTTIHITSEERTAWNSAVTDLATHKTDSTIHITSAERTAWNAKINNVTINGTSGVSFTLNGSSLLLNTLDTSTSTSAITSTDSINLALAKLQNRITALENKA